MSSGGLSTRVSSREMAGVGHEPSGQNTVLQIPNSRTRSCWLSIVGPIFGVLSFYLHVAGVGHEAEFRSWCGALRTIQCTNCVLYYIVWFCVRRGVLCVTPLLSGRVVERLLSATLSTGLHK